MSLKFKSIRELVLEMKSEEEVMEFAKGRSLAAADSSRIEGLILDQDALTQKFFKIYTGWRNKTEVCS